jgi:hypothetical protein
MKNIVKIDVQSEYGVVTKILKIDETISDGFYFVMNQDKVKSNIKMFNINTRPAKTYNDIGVQYSKNGKCVIVTFNIRQPSLDVYGQFLIGEEINPLDVLNCQHPAVNGLQSILMDACDLAKVQTMADLSSIERLIKL